MSLTRPARALVVLLLLTGPARAADLPPIWERLQHVSPAQINQLGNSLVAAITAIGALWGIRGHTKNIREGASDLWHFRANRKTYLKSEDELAAFACRVTRETSARLPEGRLEAPSLLQELTPRVESWVATVRALDEHFAALFAHEAGGSPEEIQEAIRARLSSHLRLGLPNEVSGMQSRIGEYGEIVARWERDGDPTALERWIARNTGPTGAFTAEASGTRWLKAT